EARRLRVGERARDARNGMAERPDGRGGPQGQKHRPRAGVEPPAGEDPLLRAGRGRHQGRAGRLQEESVSRRGARRESGRTGKVKGRMRSMEDTASVTPIVTLAPNAIKEVKRLQEVQGLGNAALRLGVKGGGCSGLSYTVNFDTVMGPNDQSYEIDGIRI